MADTCRRPNLCAAYRLLRCFYADHAAPASLDAPALNIFGPDSMGETTPLRISHSRARTAIGSRDRMHLLLILRQMHCGILASLRPIAYTAILVETVRTSVLAKQAGQCMTSLAL
jgi:hypothetical protein